ncbi:hypothetical protein [Arenimonas fontis]|uniref:Uncharacterized protein n=1 Tax=Arenimonas fontis TaxID=2608255 RepID=A0A5B2ZDY1_9GAMM|nr:hypothetical protein [Arenimonas fontis]KAA2285252.1 hypothetical protein F0415_04850 [Arenimonas fontis]
MIKSEPKSRVAKQVIIPEEKMPGLGTHPSAKSAPAADGRSGSRRDVRPDPRTTFHPDSHARTSHGPGVRLSGAAPRRFESVRLAPRQAAVRHGTDPVAVPL